MLTSSTFVLILLETLCGHFVLLSLAEKLIFLSKNFKLTLLFRSQERFKKFHVKNSATSTRNQQDIKKYKRRQMCNLRASFQFYQKTDHCQQGSRSFIFNTKLPPKNYTRSLLQKNKSHWAEDRQSTRRRSTSVSGCAQLSPKSVVQEEE
jgi:hypothetical protein